MFTRATPINYKHIVLALSDMGLEVKVEIDEPTEANYFTNGDTVSGLVKLHITKSLPLTSIQVKLEGVSKTSLSVPEHPDRRDKKQKLRDDLHKFLYDSQIVFPPENVRLVSNSNDFTLTPGSYTYKFSFKIPSKSSCKKLDGITNAVFYNQETFDVVIDNGTLKSTFQDWMRNANDLNHGHQSQMTGLNYHEIFQLPPSFQQGRMASIEYFIKVTCNRPSLFKVNLRDLAPFSFRPLDLDSRGYPFFESLQAALFRTAYYRRNVSLTKSFSLATKSLPLPPKKKGILSLMFGSISSKSRFPDTLNAHNVQFAFEMRLRDPPHLSPVSAADVRLFFVLDQPPSQYLRNNGKEEVSNGMGVIFLHSLVFELQATTFMSVPDAAHRVQHQAKCEETIPLFNRTFQNLQIDLLNAKSSSPIAGTDSQFGERASYEVELPQRLFMDWMIPFSTSPSFQICNIQRFYSLRVVAGLSGQPVDDSSQNAASNVNMVDVLCPDIRVLSGAHFQSTETSDSNNPPDCGSGPRQETQYPPEKQSYNDSSAQETNEGPSSALPTYDDATKHN